MNLPSLHADAITGRCKDRRADVKIRPPLHGIGEGRLLRTVSPQHADPQEPMCRIRPLFNRFSALAVTLSLVAGCSTTPDNAGNGRATPAEPPAAFGKVYLTSNALLDDATDPAVTTAGDFLIYRAVEPGQTFPQLYVVGLIYDDAGRPGLRSTPIRVSPQGSRNATPAFSPDGRSLVFASTADASIDPLADDARPAFAVRYEQLADLFRADDWQRSVAAGDPRAGVDLARHPITDGGGFDGEPAFSPDGRFLVFSSDRAAERATGRSDVDLYLAEADGTVLARIVGEPGADGAASWSPDGSAIVFESERRRPGSSDLYVLRLRPEREGGPPMPQGPARRITTAADARTPFWTTDGLIVYSAVADRGTDGARELRVVRPNGRNDRSLGIAGEAPVVTSDGRLLIAADRVGTGRQVFAVPFDDGRVVR
ncbi:MAG: hypothetical protein AAGI46_02720 [Planctomycetota bacterium]